MTERLNSEQYLEDLLMQVHQQPGLRDEEYDLGIPREDFMKVSKLSKLFLQLFTASKNDFNPDSLDVVIPGGSFHEIIGVLLAAKASGINQVNVTSLELPEREYFQSIHTEKLSGIFQTRFEGNTAMLALPMQAGEEQVQRSVSLGKVTMQLSDASSPVLASLLKSDAAMVFVGNSEPGASQGIFTNWATIGSNIRKPFLFATTATHLPRDKERVQASFNQATRGRWKKIFDGVINRNSLDPQKSRDMTHSFIFAAVRK